MQPIELARFLRDVGDLPMRCPQCKARSTWPITLSVVPEQHQYPRCKTCKRPNGQAEYLVVGKKKRRKR
jgi:transposase-like protein